MKRDHVELEKELNKIFQKKGYPGMAVSIRGPEGILFEKGFGIRNGDSKLPVDQDTVFGIASMSKSMTALAHRRQAGPEGSHSQIFSGHAHTWSSR